MEPLLLVVWGRRAVALVVLLNRVASECVCRLVPLVESDLIDEHRYLQQTMATVAITTSEKALPSPPPPPPQSGEAAAAAASSSLSATLVGAANFISKPSQSLGPMVGFALLSAIVPALDHRRSGQEGLPAGPGAPLPPAHEAPAASQLTGYQRGGVACFLLALPFACVVMQLLLWDRFTLKGRYLASVKALLSAAQDTCAV